MQGQWHGGKRLIIQTKYLIHFRSLSRLALEARVPRPDLRSRPRPPLDLYLTNSPALNAPRRYIHQCKYVFEGETKTPPSEVPRPVKGGQVTEVLGVQRRLFQLRPGGGPLQFTETTVRDERAEEIRRDLKVPFLLRWAAPLSKLFLPQGYPHTVAPYYMPYVKWMFLENVISSTAYVMSMTALLASVTSASAAVGLAAGVSWVLKDGLGALGMVFSANALSAHFDSDTKRTRWRADVLQNAGVALELLTAAFPALFLVLGAVANVCKGIAGLATGACRAAINQSLARADNLGDLTAKSASQGMLAYLLGTALGITLSSTIHGLAIAPVFLVLASLHLTASFRSLSHLEFDTMNQQRVAILLHHHLSKLPIPTPAEVASDHERIVKRPESEATRPVHLGATLTDAFKDQAAFFDSLTYARTHSHPFLLGLQPDGLQLVLEEGAPNEEVLRAFIHALRLRALLEEGRPFLEARDEASQWLEASCLSFLASLKASGWQTEAIVLAPGPSRALW